MPLSKEHRDWLSLALVPGVGSVHFIRLLARFQTPERVLSASRARLEEVVGKSLAERIAAYKEAVDVESQERHLAQFGAKLVTLEDANYPSRLAEIYDPPLLLFVRGTFVEQDENCVAIVGTRRPTPYGIRMAEKFGRELAARGVTVVSGLAAGVDAAAHRGALAAGGRTVAVLGCGVDVAYPLENAELMEAITKQGCVVSQFPMGTKPSKGHFPYRNRIISGLSQGTLIVEAPLNSGALITARQAAEQGREVFAIPGQLGVLNSQGPHALIREGAKLTETVEDILVELDLAAPVSRAETPITSAYVPARSKPDVSDKSDLSDESDSSSAVATLQAPPPAVATKQPVNASTQEKRLLAVLSPQGSHVDEIAAACRISISEALSSLTLLELKGLVRQFSGKRFAPR
jgi:DNA processing protein